MSERESRVRTSSQGILEDLLKPKELENRQVDRGMESKTSLIRTQSRIELDTVSAVELWLSLVILPDNAELDDTLGDGNDLEGGFVFWVGVEEGTVFKG